MQRLRHISQLGLVSNVYPGATHSRFEHSLGVYRLACLVLSHLLATDEPFSQSLSPRDAETFLLAALLHDVGHWPYCHPIEDLGLKWVPRHERLASRLICEGMLAQTIENQWQTTPAEVADFLSGDRESTAASGVLLKVLNGPIDIDKMDYLQRDSLHAGVPYGRNFDVGRLISSLCVDHDRKTLAISEKGKTAAEMMVFARYVMFSEVYWHHTVRSATAMLQRIVYGLSDHCDPQRWLNQSDPEFSRELLQLTVSDPGLRQLAECLFGSQRRIYKRLAQFDVGSNPEVHQRLAGRPYSELVQISSELAGRLSTPENPVFPHDVLIDAPPVKLEVQFQIDVRTRVAEEAQLGYVPLSAISPVVRSLATQQFDSYVKRVRVFVCPEKLQHIQIGSRALAEFLQHVAI